MPLTSKLSLAQSESLPTMLMVSMRQSTFIEPPHVPPVMTKGL